jgi:hypothetical protein
MSPEMTAPWNDMANGEFLWRDSNKHCAKNGYALCGWPVVDLFPGSVKSDGAYSAHKSLGKPGGRHIITKFIGDRLALPRKTSNKVGLQYYEIGAFSCALLHNLTTAADALTVTKDGIIVETAIATEAELEGSKPLSAYPQLDRPVLVSAKGEVLVSYREAEAEDARRHRVIVSNAMEALKDKDEDDATEDEDNAAKDGDSTAGAMVPKLPALKFAEGRASIVSTAKAVVKGEKKEQDTDDDDKETAKDEGEGNGNGKKGKGKGKEREKTSKKRTRKDTIISSDEDEDAEEMKEEHSSKRRKKSSKSDVPSS